MGELAELRRQREDHVEVMHRQRAHQSPRHPAGLRQRQALGTVTVTTGVVRRPRKTAGLAQLQVSTERGRAAAHDGAGGPRLLAVEHESRRARR
jgi:hypothetical protein